MARELVDSMPTCRISRFLTKTMSSVERKWNQASDGRNLCTKQERWWDHVFVRALNYGAWVNQESFFPGGGPSSTSQSRPNSRQKRNKHRVAINKAIQHFPGDHRCVQRRKKNTHHENGLFGNFSLKRGNDDVNVDIVNEMNCNDKKSFLLGTAKWIPLELRFWYIFGIPMTKTPQRGQKTKHH